MPFSSGRFHAMMPQTRFTNAILILLALTFALSADTEAQRNRAPRTVKGPVTVQAPAPDVSYTVAMTKPATHLLEVEMRVKWAAMPDQTELKMPVWTPGSYLVREYARHVQQFSAANAAGAALPWRKTTKNTWQVDTKGVGEFVAKYLVYSNELTVRTNELNDEHAFWNNTALLMFVKDQLKIPATIAVRPFGNWKVATGLPPVAGQANTFRAENYDVLYDAPFEVSNFKEFAFEAYGKPHRFVISGEGNYDAPRLVADTKKIIEETYKIFGELPYNDYTFIVNLRGGGGLEHLNSTALQVSRFGFKPDSRYKNFLALVAHEFFHAYNVKRIRPDVLGPFDYENENYTRLLWVAEGTTEYYSNLLMLRAGLITPTEYLNQRAAAITANQLRPGRFETSLESASFDAWIKYYRQDENAVNNQISYYDKGEIVSQLLDIAIRTASNGTKSLDDVMRHLYLEFYKKDRNFTDADFQKVSEMMAGKSLDDFFARYVRGTAEIDYNSIVSGIGLELRPVPMASGRAFIGADLTEDANGLRIRQITAGTPAYDQGLNTGDQIVAIDGYRASNSFLQSYLSERKPGDKIKLTVFRFDALRDFEITLGSDERKNYVFAPLASISGPQRTLLQQYLDAEIQ
jgi:predicted metalloprotease with PDZ domain